MVFVELFAELGLIQSPYAGPVFVLLTAALGVVGVLPVALLVWWGLDREPEASTERGLSRWDVALAGGDAVVLAAAGCVLAFVLIDPRVLLFATSPLRLLTTLWAGAFVTLLAVRSFTPPTSGRTVWFLLGVAGIALGLSAVGGAVWVACSGAPAFAGALWGGCVGLASFVGGSAVARFLWACREPQRGQPKKTRGHRGARAFR